MRNCKIIIVIVFSLFFNLTNYAQKEKSAIFVNDISFPRKQYMLNGVQNDMFIQTFLKRWRPYNDFVRFRGTANYLRHYEKVASIKEAKTGQTIIVDLVNGDDFKVKKNITSTIYAGEPGVGTKEVVVQFIGDSYTRGLYFKSAILEKGYVPKVKCVGLRRVSGFNGQFHEGRGGWTLENYFSNKVKNALFFNPFFQPQGEYRYWGSTAFWKNAYGIENKTIPADGFEPGYSCENYDCSKFNGEGKLIDPGENDIMYDSEKGEYQLWNGKSWMRISEEKLIWSFQYKKYLSMWNIESPEFLVVMLGLNDFRDLPIPADYSVWNSRVELLLKSYKDAVPDGKLLLCTPSTSCGSLNNESGDFTIQQNAVMWELRKNIIDVLDNREDESIYVVDASVSIDNEYGYNVKKELPYVGYAGEQRLIIQSGNPHPYLSYPNLGIPVAAFIQYYREK